MTVALWCLLVVALLPYVLAGLGGFYRKHQLGYLDNNHPREQCKALHGAGARVWAAQQNAWEALGLFTAVIVIVHLAGLEPARITIACIIFVATRVLHPVFYITNLATLRSISVIVGLCSCLYMIWLVGHSA